MFSPSTDIVADLPAYCEKHNLIGSLSNVSALLMQHVPEINWVGFYLFDGKDLRLGPFQGRTACTHIALNRGVCGAAAAQRKTLLVDDVHQFPGHIACDSASRSEIVVPIIQDGDLKGVLDVDSPKTSRFDSHDQEFFENVVRLLVTNLDFNLKLSQS